MKLYHGFTLVELMIVIAIISILAAIALPSLLESRLQSNETNAIGALRTYCTAETQYYNMGYSLLNGEDTKCYAADDGTITFSFQNLGGTNAHKTADGKPIELLPAAFTDATKAAGYHGYYFNDIPVVSAQSDHALCANPVAYGKSGRRTFIVNSRGVIFARDQGSTTEIMVWPADPPGEGWTE